MTSSVVESCDIARRIPNYKAIFSTGRRHNALAGTLLTNQSQVVLVIINIQMLDSFRGGSKVGYELLSAPIPFLW